jgi:hypothetical protein
MVGSYGKEGRKANSSPPKKNFKNNLADKRHSSRPQKRWNDQFEFNQNINTNIRARVCVCVSI